MNSKVTAMGIPWRNKLGTLALALGVSLFVGSPLNAMADKTVPSNAESFHGANIENTGDFSKLTSVSSKNAKNLVMKSYYVIPPTPEGLRPRNDRENAVGSGIAVSNNGIAFVPITDGRIIKLDVNNTSGTNADGVPKPVVLGTYDLAGETRYVGPNPNDGDEVVFLRNHPTLKNGTIYATNYHTDWQFTPDGNFRFELMYPNPMDGFSSTDKGAFVMAIDANTGDVKWKTFIEDNPYSRVAMNPIVHDGIVYVGTTTSMSGINGFLPWSYSLFPGIDPFLVPGDPVEKSGIMMRGSLVGLDEKTGEILFKTYMIPKQEYRTREQIDADGTVDLYQGVSIWGGGTPAIDTKRGQVYVGTGELYSSPIAADNCELARLVTPGEPLFNDPECLDVQQDGTVVSGPVANVVEAPNVNSPNKPLPDAVVALDAKTGKVKWGYPIHGFDVWSFACAEPVFGGYFPLTNYVPSCPPYLREDFFFLNFIAKDFDAAEQPLFIKDVKMADGSTRDMVVEGTKGSAVVALDPDTGSLIWRAQIAPPTLFGGGILWGSATDGKRLYTRSTASDITLADLTAPGNPKKIVAGSCPTNSFDAETGALLGGSYTALNLSDGSVAWTRCLTAPLISSTTLLPILDENGKEIEAAGLTESGMSYANGIVYIPGPGASYGDLLPETKQRPYLYLIDAETGQTITRLALNKDGEPAPFFQRYARPAIVGNKVIFGNGAKESGDFSRDRRVVVYELKQD